MSKQLKLVQQIKANKGRKNGEEFSSEIESEHFAVD